MTTILNLLKCIIPKKICSKFNLREIVIYNETGKFGNDKDTILCISMKRYGKCTGTSKRQWWYSGYLLKIKNNQRKAVPEFHPCTGLLNASESQLISWQGYLSI